MKTVTTDPVWQSETSADGRTIRLGIYHEPHRRLEWIAAVEFDSRWPGEGPLGWEVSASGREELFDVLGCMDMRQRIAGIRVRPGGEAPPAMGARREQLRMVWEGLVRKGRVGA